MQTVTVAGITLFELACDLLGDATQWDRIATLNRIADPWLSGLTVINIPAPLVTAPNASNS